MLSILSNTKSINNLSQKWFCLGCADARHIHARTLSPRKRRTKDLCSPGPELGRICFSSYEYPLNRKKCVSRIWNSRMNLTQISRHRELWSLVSTASWLLIHEAPWNHCFSAGRVSNAPSAALKDRPVTDPSPLSRVACYVMPNFLP